MDPRRTLCILLFAQLLLVAYCKFIAQLGSKLRRESVGDPDFAMSGIQLLARDHWHWIGLVLIALFVASLWFILSPRIEHWAVVGIFVTHTTIIAAIFGAAILVTMGTFWHMKVSAKPATRQPVEQTPPVEPTSGREKARL